MYRNIYQKLNWYTFCSSENDFDAKQVLAILNLLDIIDPLTSDDLIVLDPDDDTEFECFNFGKFSTLNPENTIVYSKKGKRVLPFPSTYTILKVAASILASIFVINSLSLNTTAYREKSFFDIIRDGHNSMKITVTGNEGSDAYITKYDNWWVLKGYYPNLMTPTYLPDYVSLDQLSERDHGSYTDFVGVYTKDLTITIRSFRENYAGDLFYDGWELFDIIDGIEYYQKGNKYKLSFSTGRYLYSVEWNDLNEVRKIIEHFS